MEIQVHVNGADEIKLFRVRLQKMTDAELLACGKRLRYLADPKTQRMGPNPAFVEQLKEARAEWRRRYPKE
jgi:hypothetical protein